MKTRVCGLLIVIVLLGGCKQKDQTSDSEKVQLVIVKRENGELKYIGYKKGDKKVGEWRVFRNERLFSVMNYYEGIQHGKEVSYETCTGKILEEGSLDMGYRVGLWYWYSKGELVATREYQDGEPKIVYHNPKFKDSVGLPPPPPNDNDCD